MSGKKILEGPAVEHAKATDLISRLSAGERWDGDNADVLERLQYAPKDPIWHMFPCPLDRVDDALAIVPEGWRTCDVDQDLASGRWLWCLADEGDERLEQGSAGTHAVALCIAILRTGESHDA